MKIRFKRILFTKRTTFIGLFFLLTSALLIGFFISYRAPTTKPSKLPIEKNSSTQKKNITSQETPAPFNTTLYSIDSPGSLWLIVNKKRSISSAYTPANLVSPPVAVEKSLQIRNELTESLSKLFNEATQSGHSLMIASGYRSYSTQVTTYNYFVAQYGEAEASRFSAKPGTSEHQTGLAVDISRTDRAHYLEESFGSDPAGLWLKDNAYKYGFIVRYPQGKEAVTGYRYEPWHLRYVGPELSQELYSKNTTMEEFFNVL